MSLELSDCSFFGPALPEPFIRFQLEGELKRRRLLPKTSGDEGRALRDRWDVYRRKLRVLGEHGGDRRVTSHVLEPLVESLGYRLLEHQAEVVTREGPELGGWLFRSADGRVLRAWSVGLGVDLDAPSRRGRAYRFSHSRVAQRVLLASGERAGLLTDGEELRLVLCDPARPDSHISIRLDRSGGWRSARSLPDSYRLLLALASPEGVAALPELTEAARLAQSTVTKKLRQQARRAIEGFLQEVLDHSKNLDFRQEWPDPHELATTLWREGLILVYRLLFILKLESSADPARAFSFAATSLWRTTYSPNTALSEVVRRVLDKGADTGAFLESGLRMLWHMFAEGMSSNELEVKPLGGMLFGAGTTPLLDRLTWGERAVARLLDALLWTPGDGKAERERVHYGSLDVEDLGRVYEALLELEPGISSEPMCRLRRSKLEVVVPLAQGAPYRADPSPNELDEDDDPDAEEEDGDEETKASGRRVRAPAGRKSKVQFVEEIPADRFFLRVGLGRKTSGSYYTPHPFVRFLVQETLGPQLAERSPREDPHPGRILGLRVLDPAMGSGHFLVEACRYLGEALYEACRLCDGLAVQAEEQAEKASGGARETLLTHAAELRKRVEDLPDPEDELVAYLPSRAAEGEESGLSQKKAEALCRRLVAVHCLYGVDKNPLAVELAKLSLWLESYAEGLPLTFMDHRLLCGDSLTGPLLKHLLTYPKSGEGLDDLFAMGLTQKLQATLSAALVHVNDLEASVGKDLADLEHKRTAKEDLDAALTPLKLLAAAWSGGVMLGDQCDDASYHELAQAVAKGKDVAGVMSARPRLREMTEAGGESVVFQLVFPEVFPDGEAANGGFDAVLGNPPWDAIQFKSKEFLAAFNLEILNAPTKRERAAAEQCLLAEGAVASLFSEQQEVFERAKRANDRLFEYQKVVVDGDLAGRQLDAFRVFMERNAHLLRLGGFTGVVVPSAFHANAGATGVRQLYLEKMALRCCFSFENRKKLFEIDSRIKFAAVVAENDPIGTEEFECGFYWHNLEQLFSGGGRLAFSLDFVRRTGGAYLSLLELRSKEDTSVARRCFEQQAFGEVVGSLGIQFGREIDTTNHSNYFVPASRSPIAGDPRVSVVDHVDAGFLLLREGKSFRQYDDLWSDPPRYLVPLEGPVRSRTEWLANTRFYRLSYRRIAGPGDENVSIWCALPPGSLSTDTSPLEVCPTRRPTDCSLRLLALMNTFPVDWVLQLRVRAHVDKFMLLRTPIPSGTGSAHFFSHSALRLTCNHAGYAPLWAEQLGDLWREPTPKHSWPVLKGDDDRWAVRSAIDAVVADAYGLDRAQYEHVLSTFSHKSYPKAPALCLAAFDDLKAIGLEAFTEKHDPYWDVPLNESLPKPVIDLPLPDERASAQSGLGPLFDRIEGEAATATEGGAPQSAPPAARQPAWMARTPIDRQVLILSRVVDAHQRANRLHSLGNVKAEKLAYLVEAHVGVDLDREPMREAAGPADFPRLKKAVHRGSKLHAFSVRGSSRGSGGVWSPGSGLRKRLGEFDELFAVERSEIDRIIDLFVPMDSEQAEIVATLYACWNDLLAGGAPPGDAAIVEDFYRWAEGKRRFDAGRLGKALAWMRDHDLVPSGSAPRTRVLGDGGRTKAVSHRERGAAADKVYAIVAKLLDERGVISSKDAQTATSLDATAVRPHLKRLVEEGRAVTEGERRGMKYRRSDG